MGIAFDGDGDRIGVVDDKARIVPRHTTFNFSKRYDFEEKDSSIIGDVKCSQVLFDEIKKVVIQ